jgi:hypothetical protein
MEMRGRFIPNHPLAGYIAVIISKGNGSPTLVYEAFPKHTTYTTNGKPRFGTRKLFDGSTFYWEAEGIGHLSQDEIDIKIPGSVSIYSSIEKRLPWQFEKDRLGPEGMILRFPFVPAHWFVHSLGSKASYELTYKDSNNEDVSVTSNGYLHQEKNWGTAFPTGWIWSQGIGKHNQTQYALAGGFVKMPMIKKFKSWLIGIRGKKIRWDFRKSRITTKFKSVIDPCHGTFEITARDSKHYVKILAQAPLNTFGSVSIPTVNGFKANGGVESFSAKVEIKAYLRKHKRKILKEVLHFNNAALEFGAGFMCPKP